MSTVERGVARFGALALGVAMAAAAVLPAAASAQFGPDPRSAGMGGAFLGLARGYEALYWNPANLGLTDGPSSSMAFAIPGAVATTVGPGFRDFDILADESPSAERQQAFLSDVPAGGADFRADVTVPWFSFSAGKFAFGIATTALVKGDLSKELLELYLDLRDDSELNTQRLASYRVGDTGYRDAAITRFTAAYAVPFDAAGTPVSVGVGVHYVLGHRLDRGRLFEPVVQDDHLVITGVALRSPGGQGYGVDLGLSAQPADGLTLGLAVQNAFQRMEWDEELEILGDEFTTDELDEEGVETVLERFEARPFDPAAAPLEAYRVGQNLLRDAYLPRVVTLGAGYRVRGTSLGATFRSTSDDGALHAGWSRYLGLGIEQRLYIVSVRAGYANSLSGASAITLGGGLNLGAARLTAAVARTTGSSSIDDDGPIDEWRYADQLAAGSGYAATLGLSLVFD